MQRTISMLVADDSHVVQQIFIDAARASKLPLRISSTDNGRDCFTLLSGGNIDLAFIDVHMPELSGIEAFWAARKQGIRTFVTVMSNPPSPEAVEMARKLNAYEFLFKPFAVADALAIMKTYSRITSPMKVLIVDDNGTSRQILRRLLSGWGAEPVLTDSGPRALELIHQHALAGDGFDLFGSHGQPSSGPLQPSGSACQS